MMLIKVKVKPNSKKSSIEEKDEDRFVVMVRSKPRDGEANKEVLELLAEFLGVERKKLRIVKGSKERNKIVKLS
ncbi:MAG: DUF167 domain-containing protein [Patescibacteria group bacterium]|nr:DUF167 domain-containing protein [Patescibacteria group bacterium]